MNAKTRSQATRKSSSGGFLFGVFVGVVFGLAVALGIAFYLKKTPIPFLSAKPKPPAEKDAPGKPPAIAGLPQPSAPQGDKPKFDFYKILPGSEEPVSDKELRDRAKGGQQGAPNDVYFIQAGSFQNPADADNQKARLAILGFESSVEPASLPEKGTWYRVRLGPFTRVEDINKVRQSLAQAGIEANLIKIKESQ